MHDQKLEVSGKHAVDEKTTFRGRRHGRKLRPQLDKLFKENLHTFLVEEGLKSDKIDLTTFFSIKPKKFWLEIGFGGGEHLAWQAKLHPEIGFLGFEPYINGVASLVRHLVSERLSNVRIFPEDIRPFLNKLPNGCISKIFILFPDPWPKSKHRKRRIIQYETLSEFHRILKPKGKLRIATDHVDYLTWILIHFNNFNGFQWVAKSPKNWRCRVSNWPQTRYEQKAIRQGREPAFLEYRRCDRPTLIL
ncbi:MAG: tRNA (guanosine(46)-N7)-methyltransferase TrmB [Pseudomonadota bacterium]|nr:tRNA (guanosine(46)-N7)-methyltransferase TrmB [Pseudomonadota bacterium]